MVTQYSTHQAVYRQAKCRKCGKEKQPVYLGRTISGIAGFFTGNALAFQLDSPFREPAFDGDQWLAMEPPIDYACRLGFALED